MLLQIAPVFAQTLKTTDLLENNFRHPPESARPWVFWYWMHAAVSKEGITADLEAMKEVGIAGAYLMPIQDTVSTIPFQLTARQLTPGWWALVKFAMQESKRLDLKLAMHFSDGFALGGGPWIRPEMSMQKIVWTKNYVKNGSHQKIILEQPQSNEDHYKDIAIFAYPANSVYAFSDVVLIPSVSNSLGTNAQFLSFRSFTKDRSFKVDSSCWIQYKYPEPFTCRSVTIHVGGNNYQAQRLTLQASDDGKNFKTIIQLEPPRHGWQDTDEDVTSAIPEITAKYFRFVYDKKGTEPGAEDLDAAKWKSSLKVVGIYLSDEPVINQFETKNGSIWRVSKATTDAQVPKKLAVPLSSIINLTGKIDRAGNLDWEPPAGNWVIVRIGNTTTGSTNATGGAGRGLECDKFNPAAIKLQFDNWFAKAFEKTDPALASEVLKVFHVDSWECGSQNWSSNFNEEFKKRRGYDLIPYLLTMTGVPVEDAATSEKVLLDVRQTIADLINDVFYVTLNKLAHEKGCSFSAESVAPTMVSDGLLHYKNVDLPMGEFWLNSPTHDKPNDMLDAISGAHIYGKNIIQAESFTTLRMDWGEHPGNLKITGDRNLALGINKMVLHVFTHNPWIDKKPGMTLDGVGLYYQRDQTWFKQSKAWIDYLSRSQALLQKGIPVADIGVFIGEEVPRRAVLPDRLVNTLPGIFGKEKLASEKNRLENIGQPLREKPDGVNHSANMADPEDWVNPLNGYAYDSFNPDALMMMLVKDGRVVLPGGASYKILIIPGNTKMNPENRLSDASAKKITNLVKAGATVVIDKVYTPLFSANGMELNFVNQKNNAIAVVGKGRFVLSPYRSSDFNALGLERDVEIASAQPGSIAYTHRVLDDTDIYFFSNQAAFSQNVKLRFRIMNKTPEAWDAVTGDVATPVYRGNKKGKTEVIEKLQPGQSVFIIFRKPLAPYKKLKIAKTKPLLFSKSWKVQFNKNYGGPQAAVELNGLKSWTEQADTAVKFYSGTAVYSNTFFIKNVEDIQTALLQFESIKNIATVKINGIDCGTLWTMPYTLDVAKALKTGENNVEIEVSNTWHNRLILDNLLPEEKRITFTTAPFRLKDKPLLPAGIIGKVLLSVSYK